MKPDNLLDILIWSVNQSNFCSSAVAVIVPRYKVKIELKVESHMRS